MGLMEPPVLVPPEDNNGEAIWQCVASQILQVASQDFRKALFPYHRRGPMHWVLAFAVGDDELLFDVSTPLSQKQLALLRLVQQTNWEDLAPKDLGFLFHNIITFNFSLEKKKLHCCEKN